MSIASTRPDAPGQVSAVAVPRSSEAPPATLPIPNALGYVLVGLEVAAVIALPFAVVASGTSLGDAWTNLDLHNLGIAALLGALILWKRPGHVIGWLLVLAGSFDFLVVSAAAYRYVDPDGGGGLPGGDAVWESLNFCWVLGAIFLLIALPQLFPNGRLLSRRWRPLFWACVGAPMPLVVLFKLDPREERLMPLFDLAFPLFALAILASVTPLIVRFTRTSGAERQQIKWVFYGLAVSAPITALGFALPAANTNPVSPVLSLVPLVVIPFAIAVAVLRYRLYDIDVVINKSLVFVVLAAFITGVYAVIVVGLGRLLPIGEGNLGLAIAATALVAVAFEPVRVRVQHWANRLVYGKRATPYEALAAMTARIAESADPGEVLGEAARLLAEGSGAEQAVVWVVQEGFLVPRGATGDSVLVPAPIALAGDALPSVPASDLIQAVRQDGQLVGALSLRKRPGEGVSTADRRLVEELAGQAALLLANTRLRSRLADRVQELRASRQRMLAAQDRARRVLERDLHDGAQQELVALKVKLGLARTIASREGASDVAARLAETGTIADLAVDTLRDVARGIYPPLLESEGLAAALSAQARRADLAVTVLDRAGRRFPREVEATAYFCALEALQNAVRHARAEHAHIALEGTDSILTVVVTDDGDGFDADAIVQRTGLTHMTDRADSAGGTLLVTSRPGRGTSVSLAVPVPVPVPEAVGA